MLLEKPWGFFFSPVLCHGNLNMLGCSGVLVRQRRNVKTSPQALIRCVFWKDEIELQHLFSQLFFLPTNQWVEFPENGKSPVSQVSSSQGDNLRILVWSEQQRWIQSRFIFSSTTKSWETAHHSKTWNGCFCLINDSVDTSSGLSNNQVLFFFICFFLPKSKVFFTYQLALSDRRSFCSQDQLRPGGGGHSSPSDLCDNYQKDLVILKHQQMAVCDFPWTFLRLE